MELALIAEHQKRIQGCRTCKGHGYVLNGHGKSVKCQCLLEFQYNLLMVKSGIPPRFKNLAFKDYMYQNSPTFAKIWKYINKAELAVERGYGLFLYGPTFSGKTMLACCILKELMWRGYDCGFVTFSGIMSNPVEADKFIGKENTFACIDNLSSVLDRLVNFTETNLTHRMTNGAINQLVDVLSARIMRNQPTILTSDVSIREISENSMFRSLGELLVGSFGPVECVSGDFRGERARDRLSAEFGFDEIA